MGLGKACITTIFLGFGDRYWFDAQAVNSTGFDSDFGVVGVPFPEEIWDKLSEDVVTPGRLFSEMGRGQQPKIFKENIIWGWDCHWAWELWRP